METDLKLGLREAGCEDVKRRKLTKESILW
jgi:hypothetical protein